MSFENPKPKTTDEQLRDLLRNVEKHPDDMGAQERLNSALERFRGIIRRQVPVETPRDPSSLEGNPQAQPEMRWVEWKRVYDKEGREIPGSIEKILRVKLRNAPLQELIDEGHYYYTHPNITAEHFPPEQSDGDMDFPLIQFGRIVETEEVNEWFEQNKLRGATLKETLAIGSQYPEIQRRVYVVGLGQPWQETEGRTVVLPILPRNVQRRELNLCDVENPWRENGRFPAAHKRSTL